MATAVAMAIKIGPLVVSPGRPKHIRIRNRRKQFCRVPHGELMAKNGSIPSRNKKDEAI